MNTLLQFLSEAKNTHLEHLEDDIINNGVVGGRNAINFLVALKDMLEGNTKRPMNVTVKWDGAPAIFAGTNPANGKFFVGTKSIFNKTPKINYTNADIDGNDGGVLADKLKVALKYFGRLYIPGIWQGDLLYTDDDLSEKDMGGENSILKPGLKDNDFDDLYDLVVLKDRIAEYLWYMLTGALVIQNSHSYIMSIKCKRSASELEGKLANIMNNPKKKKKPQKWALGY